MGPDFKVIHFYPMIYGLVEVEWIVQGENFYKDEGVAKGGSIRK